MLEFKLELLGMVISIVGDYGYIKVNKRIVDVVIEWIKENKE